MKKIIINIVLIMMFASSCTQKYPLELGGGYKVDYDGNSYFYLLDKNNTVVIESHIISFKEDSKFIIVEQKPVKLILDSINKTPHVTLKKRNKVFKKSKLKEFWIINKVSNNIYGPLKKNVYLQKRVELKIPKELELKE